MNILMIGDVVAKPGRVAVLERIQDLREQYKIDLAVMNAENLAGGFSVTPSLCEQLFSSGIDVICTRDARIAPMTIPGINAPKRTGRPP